MKIIEPNLTAPSSIRSAQRPLGSHLAIRSAAAVFGYAVLIVLAVLMLFPYAWMLNNSIKPQELFYTQPYAVILNKATLQPYVNALVIGRVAIYLRNSVTYASSVVLAQLLIDSLAAFGFARLRFPGRDLIFAVFLSTMMLPYSVLLIPSYLLIRSFGLADTYLGVVLPSFAGVFGTFLLRQFFLNIPSEIEDAARIDGASLFRIYSTIILPLAQPALITLGIFLFMSEWSSYIWPLVVVNDWNKYPITVGIALFQQETNIEWPNILAASTLASFPLILLFLLAQRYIIGGITLSGLKG